LPAAHPRDTARIQQLGHLTLPWLRQRAEPALKALRQEKDEIEALIKQTIANDPELARRFALPGAGPVEPRRVFRRPFGLGHAAMAGRAACAW
jgi:hypothetical protein